MVVYYTVSTLVWDCIPAKTCYCAKIVTYEAEYESTIPEKLMLYPILRDGGRENGMPAKIVKKFSGSV